MQTLEATGADTAEESRPSLSDGRAGYAEQESEPRGRRGRRFVSIHIPRHAHAIWWSRLRKPAGRRAGRVVEAGPVETPVKRAIDLTLASGLWVLSLPLVGLIAAAIKLDSPGPVFFAQKRPGLGGRYFRLYKFRTMHTDSQQLFDQLPDHLKEEFAAYGKIREDPRVTRIGRLLRRMSLDELPQLWNVVRGDMSLVGPRPYLRRQMRDLAGRKQVILRIRPGLTGLWQVTGRNDIPFRRRLILDIWYVRNQSPRVDAVILLRTVPAVLRAEGAY